MYKESANLETLERLSSRKIPHVNVGYASAREGEFTHNRSRQNVREMGSTPFPNSGQNPRFLKVLLFLNQLVSPGRLPYLLPILLLLR